MLNFKLMHIASIIMRIVSDIETVRSVLDQDARKRAREWLRHCHLSMLLNARYSTNLKAVYSPPLAPRATQAAVMGGASKYHRTRARL